MFFVFPAHKRPFGMEDFKEKRKNLREMKQKTPERREPVPEG